MIAVLISGQGTNLKALIDDGIEIAVVVSNNANAYGLQRAQSAGIPTVCISNEDELIGTLQNYELDLIVLAGYMRILSPHFVSLYERRIINIHPSLLPKYPGLNTHQRAIDAGDDEHGCTIHFVTEELDTGPIIAQEKLLITNWDNVDMLKHRVQALEHALYSKTIRTLLRS